MASPAAPLQTCPQAGRNYDYEMEPGLRYDILSQVGALLKSNVPSRPLAGFKVVRIFLYGQTGGDMPTGISAINLLADLENGKPVWDGYFIKGRHLQRAHTYCQHRQADCIDPYDSSFYVMWITNE